MKKGFTLIELLVVIAIIGVLIALLLPFKKENTPAWSVATGGAVNPLERKGSTMVSVKESALKVQAGQRYGKWEVLGSPFSSGHSHSALRWVCVARCGACRVAAVLPCIYLRKGERHGAKCTNCQHGEANVGRVTRLYSIWSCMRNRCHNPNNHAFARYGGRGISVCREWEQYKVFKRWALDSGYQENLTIDRKENSGNYEPGNCRWIPLADQARNTRHNRLVTAFGETKTLVDWSEDIRCSVSYGTIKCRLRAGWDAERAISAAKQRQGKT